MRIAMPTEHLANPIPHLPEHYAAKIVTAAFDFSRAVYQHSKLSLREFEGARARTAEINGCAVCRSFRAGRDMPGYFENFGGDAAQSVLVRGPAPDENFYQNVSKSREDAQYSERERLTIAYAEGMGLDPQGLAVDEAFWARLRAAFSDEEIVDLTYSVGSWIALGRSVHLLGMDATCGFIPMEKVA
jgi:hypothetical protein